MIELLSRNASEEEYKEAYEKTHYINARDIRILRALRLINRDTDTSIIL